MTPSAKALIWEMLGSDDNKYTSGTRLRVLERVRDVHGFAQPTFQGQGMFVLVLFPFFRDGELFHFRWWFFIFDLIPYASAATPVKAERSDTRDAHWALVFA
jgi:hypothetical protein